MCHRALIALALLGAGVTIQSAAEAPAIYAPTSGLEWRNIGPFRAGRVSAVAGAIGQPGVFYIGLPFGGVWKTTSAGTTWFPVFDAVHEMSSIASIDVAPSDPDVVYVGTGDPYRAPYRGNGIYRSADAGKTWRHLTLGDTKVPAVLVDPKNPDIVVAAALGNVQTKSGARGVFRTTDGGATWTRTLAVDDEVGVQDIARAFDEPRVIVAVTGRYYAPGPDGPAPMSASTGALYKSVDEGQTWTPLAAAGLPPIGGNAGRLCRVSLAAHTNAQRMLLAGTGRLFRSDDGGASWRAVASNDPRVGSERAYIDPANPDVVFDMHTTMYRSTDGGNTFAAFKGAPGGDDPHVLWIDPTDSRRMLLAGDQGASVSMDAGLTWTSWYNQSTAQLYHIAVDRSWPYWVYGQQQDSGAVAVRSRGDLGSVGPLDWYPTPGWESGYITSDPLNPKIVYANGPDAASQLVRISVGAGNQWIHVGPNLDPAQGLGTPGPLEWSPFNPRELLVGYNKLMSTVDGGRHWKPLSPDLTSGRGSILSLSPSSMAAGLIWVGLPRGGVKLTHDDGATWIDAPIPNLPAQASVVSIDASHQNAAVAFVAVATGDNRPHVFRTRDFGRTWTEIVAGLPVDQVSGSFANVVRADTRRAGLVFVGTESSVYVSFNDGDAWQSLRLNLPTTSVRDVQIHDNDLVIGTFGRGIWVLDDYSPLRQIAATTSSAAAQLFKPGAGVRVRSNIGGDTPFPPEIPHAENPPPGVIVYYWLSRSPATPIAIDILDALGRVVRHLSSAPVEPLAKGGRDVPDFWLREPQALSTEIGLNRVSWNVRYDDPPSGGEHITIRAVPGETPVTYEGPLVLPGVYTVRLTVDGKPYVQTVRVRNDPRSGVPLADLRAQHALQMHLYRESQVADTAARQVSVMRDAVGALTESASAEVVTTANALSAALGSAGGGRAGRGRRAGVGGSPPGVTAGRGPVVLQSFDSIRESMDHLLEELDSADMAPTPAMTGAYAAACRDLKNGLAAWRTIQSENLAALNAALTANHVPPLAVPSTIAAPVCPTTAAR